MGRPSTRRQLRGLPRGYKLTTVQHIAGGASAVRQALQARCLNELVLDIVPVVLGDGERIFDDVPEFHAEAVEAATSPLATHIVYKIT